MKTNPIAVDRLCNLLREAASEVPEVRVRCVPDDYDPQTDWVEFKDGGGGHMDPNPYHFNKPVLRSFIVDPNYYD